MKKNEAQILGYYLVKDDISSELQERYFSALKFTTISEDFSTVIFNKSLKNKWMIPYFDAAYALIAPNCYFRKRLFLMLAILEATPEYFTLFIQKPITIFGYFKFFLIGFRSIYRALLGLLLNRIYSN